MEKKIITSFVKQCLAKFKGDTDEVLAQKNYRIACAAINQQLAALKVKEIEAEQNVETVTEALENAKYPTVLITNNQSYIEVIKNTEETLEIMKQDLEDVKSSIKYFEELLKSYN